MLVIDLEYKTQITALVYEQFLKEEKKRNLKSLHTEEEKRLANSAVSNLFKVKLCYSE